MTSGQARTDLCVEVFSHVWHWELFTAHRPALALLLGWTRLRLLRLLLLQSRLLWNCTAGANALPAVLDPSWQRSCSACSCLP